MASLRNIMNNVDDDSQPRRAPGSSTPTPVPHSSPLPSSSYTVPSDLSMNHPSSSSYSRGDSPHSAYSHAPESSASRHPHQHLPLPPGRRDSTGTNDHIAYSYSHAQSYNTGHDMRPLMTGSVMGEPGVKLTPITGRVSRAKKGVPVHTCEMCRPPKTFTRAEHLRRHQLSHQPPDLACKVPGCSKVFHRKDLLERHQQRHEQDERLAAAGQPLLDSSPREQSQHFGGSPPSSALHMGYGAATSSSRTMAGTPRHEASGSSNWNSTSRPFGHTLPPPRISASSQQYYAHSPHARYSTDSTPGSQAGSPPAGDTAPSSSNVQESTAASLKTPETGHDFYMSDGDQSNSPDLRSSATGSTYSTPSDSSNERLKRARSSSTEWKSAATQFTTSPAMHTSFNMTRQATTSYGYGSPDPLAAFSIPTQNVTTSLSIPGYYDEPIINSKPLLSSTSIRTLPVPYGAGRSSDVLMAMPPMGLPDRLVSPQLAISPASIGILDAFSGHGLPVLTLSQNVRGLVPVYLDLYWNKVHAMYPVIHRPTFETARGTMSEATDTLQCVMAAVATQFLGHEDHRINGSQLHSYAASRLKMASTAEQWSLQTMQAALLSEYYMRFRGRDKDAYRTSPLFSALYKLVYRLVTAQSSAVEFGQQRSWAEWAEDEALRRLLASCFLLDVHCMRYFEQAPISVQGLDYTSPSTLAVPLSANTAQLWEASSLDKWSKLDCQRPRVSVGEAVVRGFKPADIQESCPFDASVLLAAYSLQIPMRQNPTRLDLIQDVSVIDLSQVNVLNLFAPSAVANTYLALHFTPLHVVLSVSGDSWVFNKKVLRLASFTQQQNQLCRWRDSGSSAAAAAFAARALVVFLGLGSDNHGTPQATPMSPCADISDFWGIYVCALICWSFGHVGREGTGTWKDGSSRPAAVQWLQSAAKLQPAQVQRLSGRRNAQAVVGLAREALEREHFGRRSILISDAVGVLKKLEDGDGCKRF